MYILYQFVNYLHEVVHVCVMKMGLVGVCVV